MKKNFLIFSLLILSSFSHEQKDTFIGKVTAVIDGDTIDVLRDGKTIRIRLNGIDCPEKSQTYGTKAKQFTSDFLFGKTVRVVGNENDRYGRLLADIYVDAANTQGECGAWFNKAIVASGFAWHYKKYSSDPDLGGAEQR